MLQTIKNIFNARPPKRMESEIFVIRGQGMISNPKLAVYVQMRYGIMPETCVQLIAERTKNNDYRMYIVDGAQKAEVKPAMLRTMNYFQARQELENFDATAHKIWTRYFSPVVTGKNNLKCHHSAISYRPKGCTN